MDIQREALANAMYCTAAMAANMLFCQIGHGMSRFPAGERPPEDSILLSAKKVSKHGVEQNFDGSGMPKTDRSVKAKEKATRWGRILTNNLENIPMGVIAGWASLIATKGSEVQVRCFIGFAVARWLHTISYMYALQPWRAISWLVAWVSVIGMLYTGVAASM